MDLTDSSKLYQQLKQLLIRLCDSDEVDNIESELVNSFSVMTLSAGQRFVSEGEVPPSLGFVCNGLLKYYYIDSDGNEWIKHFSAENDFVSSYGAFLYQTPSLYYIEAIEEVVLLTIPFKVFNKNIDKSLFWSTIARKYTEYIYYQKEKREASFLQLDGTERYQAFLNEYPNLVNRISIKDTASFLGLTSVSLSRIRNKLSSN